MASFLHPLHILLRHCLLVIPHGMEGFGFSPELTRERDQTAGHSEEKDVWLPNRDARSSSRSDQLRREDHLVAEIDYWTGQLDLISGEHVFPPTDVASDGLTPVVDASVRLVSAGMPLNILVEHIPPRRACVEVLDHPATHRHVLLRHRLLRQTEVGERAVAVTVEDQLRDLAVVDLEKDRSLHPQL